MDLPGPKMRLGEIPSGLIELEAGNTFTLTSDDIPGDRERAFMSFEPLPRVVKPGDRLFLNDGLVQLPVDHVLGKDVVCQVAVGGPISSRKGLNLPGIDLGISAFTDHDRKCLEFTLGLGVDAVSQSFVECAKDMEAVRAAVRRFGSWPSAPASPRSSPSVFPPEFSRSSSRMSLRSGTTTRAASPDRSGSPAARSFWSPDPPPTIRTPTSGWRSCYSNLLRRSANHDRGDAPAVVVASIDQDVSRSYLRASGNPCTLIGGTRKQEARNAVQARQTTRPSFSWTIQNVFGV
jgi:hypothetical protein